MDARNTFAGLIVTAIFVFAFGTMAIASDMAFYAGFTLWGWDEQAADVEKTIQDAGHQFNDILQFDETNSGCCDRPDEFGPWIDANSADGDIDIVWLNGQIPNTFYPVFNEAEDGSRVEKWLDDGNIVIVIQDWFA